MHEHDAAFEEGPFNTKEAPLKKDAARPAGFLRRALAYTIDAAIVLLLLQIFLLVGLFGQRLSGGGIEDLDLSVLGIGLLNNFLFIAVGYFTFFHTHCGQTPAKMILRIQVVNKELQHPSPLQAFVRTLCYFTSGLFLGLGFFITLFEGKKRALHDLLTGTQVILSP